MSVLPAVLSSPPVLVCRECIAVCGRWIPCRNQLPWDPGNRVRGRWEEKEMPDLQDKWILLQLEKGRKVEEPVSTAIVTPFLFDMVEMVDEICWLQWSPSRYSDSGKEWILSDRGFEPSLRAESGYTQWTDIKVYMTLDLYALCYPDRSPVYDCPIFTSSEVMTASRPAIESLADFPPLFTIQWHPLIHQAQVLALLSDVVGKPWSVTYLLAIRTIFKASYTH